jgi:hypothetical protein
MRLAFILAIWCMALLALSCLNDRSTNGGLPLVAADYPLCVTVKPPSLLRSPQGRLDYRADPGAFNDKGVS